MSDEPEVIETGDRFVFMVRSHSNPNGLRHRVDLTGMGGATECDCIDWSTRRGPAIKAGMLWGTRHTLCRHGIAARRYFLNLILKDLAKPEHA